MLRHSLLGVMKLFDLILKDPEVASAMRSREVRVDERSGDGDGSGAVCSCSNATHWRGSRLSRSGSFTL